MINITHFTHLLTHSVTHLVKKVNLDFENDFTSIA